MQDKTYTMSMLYDFYGDLLTTKQRECFSRRYNEDFTLAEIAETEGITRQAVLDLLKRAEQTMTHVEEKTGAVRRFQEMQEIISEIESELAELRDLSSGRALELADSINSKLHNLKD